jgi:hypothetical protein
MSGVHSSNAHLSQDSAACLLLLHCFIATARLHTVYKAPTFPCKQQSQEPQRCVSAVAALIDCHCQVAQLSILRCNGELRKAILDHCAACLLLLH